MHNGASAACTSNNELIVRKGTLMKVIISSSANVETEQLSVDAEPASMPQTYEQDGEHVYCESCANCIVPGKDSPTWRWLCGATKRYKTGFVTRKFFDKDPPYLYCVYVNNDGHCTEFNAKDKEK
jgi:hypothetical protein